MAVQDELDSRQVLTIFETVLKTTRALESGKTFHRADQIYINRRLTQTHVAMRALFCRHAMHEHALSHTLQISLIGAA